MNPMAADDRAGFWNSVGLGMGAASLVSLAVLVLPLAPFSTATAQDSPTKYVLIGLGVGAGLGLIIGGVGDFNAGGFDEGTPNPDSFCFDNSCWLIGAAIGGGTGALFGAAFWYADKSPPGVLKAVSAGVALGVVGAVIGASIGNRAENSAVESVAFGENPNACIDADCVLIGAAILGGVGFVVGTVAGAMIQEDKEEPDQVTMSFAPQRGGRLALGLSVRF